MAFRFLRTSSSSAAILAAFVTACSGSGDGSGGSGGSGATSAGGAGGAGATSAGGTAAGGTGGTGTGGSVTSQSRGYFTTPEELAGIKQRADQGKQPYKDAVDELVAYAGAPGDWPYGSVDGNVDCAGPDEPPPLWNGEGGPLVLAKAYLYHLTGDEAFAESARLHVLDLTDTTGWGGDVFSGANQCILNLSWFIPRFIQAAELLEGYAGWSTDDRETFASWLAAEVYLETSWSSSHRMNNWGSAGSYTSAMIADYLVQTTISQLVDEDGTSRSLAEAWTYHRSRQLARMDGTDPLDTQCAIWGIQDHGGIPDELRRGTSGCDATYILEQDASYTYQLAHIQALVAHAELLLRRGDKSMFDNVAPNGMGSIQQSILFVIQNPTQSWPWSNNHMPTLDISYRYYRDPAMCAELVCDDVTQRVISGEGNRVMSFGTLTHGFAPDENPGPPPVVAPPGG
jgi:hypothetical protein